MKLNPKLGSKMNFLPCWIGGALLLAASLLRPISPSQKQTDAKSASAVASASRERVISEVEPFCRMLVPEHDALRFQASLVPVYSQEGETAPLWIVECFEASGKKGGKEADQEILHALWNDREKRFFAVSVIKHSPARTVPVAGKKQADAAARRWLARLNMASQADILSGVGETALLGDIWHVNLRLPGGRAVAWIDARSGALQSIRARGNEVGAAGIARTPPHPAAPPPASLPGEAPMQRDARLTPRLSAPDA